MERKSKSSYDVVYKSISYIWHKKHFKKCRFYSDVDDVIATLSRLYRAHQAYSMAKPIISFNSVYSRMYDSDSSIRREATGTVFPNYLKRGTAWAILKEMGVIRMSGKGKVCYKVTDFDDWAVIIDRKTFVRTVHTHEGGTAYRSNYFKDNHTGEKTPYKCVKCFKIEPKRVKGFVLLHTVVD